MTEQGAQPSEAERLAVIRGQHTHRELPGRGICDTDVMLRALDKAEARASELERQLEAFRYCLADEHTLADGQYLPCCAGCHAPELLQLSEEKEARNG